MECMCRSYLLAGLKFKCKSFTLPSFYTFSFHVSTCIYFHRAFVLFLTLVVLSWHLCSNLVSVSLCLFLRALWKPINPIRHIWISPDKWFASPAVSVWACPCDEDQHISVWNVRIVCTHRGTTFLSQRWIKVQGMWCRERLSPHGKSVRVPLHKYIASKCVRVYVCGRDRDTIYQSPADTGRSGHSSYQSASQSAKRNRPQERRDFI